MASPSPVTYYPGTTRRFAPGPWIYTGQGDVSALNSAWNEYFEPYYRGWINRNRGELPGVWIKNQGIRMFYVDENKEPANPTNPNDSNYTWAAIDDFLNDSPCLSSGRAALHILMRMEGAPMFPNWMENKGFIWQPPDQQDLKKQVPTFSNACTQAFKDFFEAFATRYNSNNSVYTLGFGESSKRGTDTDPNVIDLLQHIADECSSMMVQINSNGTLYQYPEIISDKRFMIAHPDPKPFSHGCEVNWPNCNSNSHFFKNNAIGTTVNAHAVNLGSEPNGLNLIGDNHTAPNPFGVTLPHASRSMPNTDLDYFVLLWYFSAAPRAPSPRDNSNMGRAGRDPNGILPVTNFGVAHGGSSPRSVGVTPQHVNAAMRAFGASGTQALFWPPIGFDPGGSAPDPDPVIYSADDGTIYNGETGFDIQCNNAEDSKGAGWVRIYENSNQSGDYATQTTTSWSDGQITITGVQGSVDAGTAYLFIKNNSGETSAAFEITMQADSANGPVIQSIDPSTLVHGRTVTVSGTDFGATEGEFEINTSPTGHPSGTGASQTITEWTDTRITATIVANVFEPGATVYALVQTAAPDFDLAPVFTLTVQPVGVPVIINAEDEVFYDGETGVVVDGIDFGSDRDSGTLFLSDRSDNSGINVQQGIEAWTDTRITTTIVLGAINEGDELYLKVSNDAGQTSPAYPVEVRVIQPAPNLDAVQPDTVADGTEITINGRYFGDQQSGGNVTIYQSIDAGGVSSICTILSWSETRIRARVRQRSLPAGTRYLLVSNAGGAVSEGYPLTLTEISVVPVITSVGNGIFYDGETSLTITGTNFEATKGAGKLYLNDDPTINNAVEQPTTSWGDTSIGFTAEQGSIPTGPGYAMVINDAGGLSQPMAIVFIAQPGPGVIDTLHSDYSDSAGFADWAADENTSLDDSGMVYDTDTDTITDTVVIGDDAGADRMLIAGTAARSTNNASVGELAVKLDGVSGTLVDKEFFAPGDGVKQKVALWQWRDADLPASAGSYTLEYTLQSATSNYVALCFGLWPGIAQQDAEASISHELDNVTSISKNITTVSDDALLVDLGFHRLAGALTETAGSREIEANTTGIGVSLGAEFRATAGLIARGWDSAAAADSMLLVSAAFAVSGAGGANDAYNSVARETPGDDSGDLATFVFQNVPSATQIIIEEWHPTGAAATNVPLAYSGISSGSGTVDQSTAGGQWQAVKTITGSPISAGTLTVTLGDNANDAVIANALRLIVTPLVTGVTMDMSETLVISEEMKDAGVGRRIGGASSATVIIDGTTISEDIQNLDTATIATATGDFRVPLTKTFGSIQAVNVEIISSIGGWDWTLEDRESSGPRLRIWRFSAGSWIPADAVVNITVTGVGAETSD